MSGGAVVVVGSANVDLVWQGARLPRPGETVTDGTFRETFGGKGANQASASARLGAATAFVGCVGTDDRGARTRVELRDRGIDCTWLATAGTPTGVALIAVAAGGENTVLVAPGANRDLTAAHVHDAIAALARPGTVVLVSLEVPVEVAEVALRGARAAGATTVCNPAPFRDDGARCFASCDVVVPNRLEAEQYGGVAAILAACPPGATVIVTRGAEGAQAHDASGEVATIEPFALDAVDTTGAGDAFCGALAARLAAGASLTDAARFACAAGALACTGLGARAALPDEAQVVALMAPR
jgi:ribokinase